MNMNNIIFILLLLVIILPISIVIKFMDLGISFNKSIILTYAFPKIVIKTHFRLYKKSKQKSKKIAIRVLLFPITNLPIVLTTYAKSAIVAEAKLEAITEMAPTLSKYELNRFKKVLRKEGINLKIKNGNVKVSVTKDRGKDNTQKNIWREFFNREVTESINKEVSRVACTV